MDEATSPDIASDANVKQIIVAGYFEQSVEGIPAGIPVAVRSYFPNSSEDYFYAYSEHSRNGREARKYLKKATGLDIKEFHTLPVGSKTQELRLGE